MTGPARTVAKERLTALAMLIFAGVLGGFLAFDLWLETRGYPVDHDPDYTPEGDKAFVLMMLSCCAVVFCYSLCRLIASFPHRPQAANSTRAEVEKGEKGTAK